MVLVRTLWQISFVDSMLWTNTMAYFISWTQITLSFVYILQFIHKLVRWMIHTNDMSCYKIAWCYTSSVLITKLLSGHNPYIVTCSKIWNISNEDFDINPDNIYCKLSATQKKLIPVEAKEDIKNFRISAYLKGSLET